MAARESVRIIIERVRDALLWAARPGLVFVALGLVLTILIVEPGGKISYTAEGWSKKEMEKLGQQAGVPVIRPGGHVPEVRLRIPQAPGREPQIFPSTIVGNPTPSAIE